MSTFLFDHDLSYLYARVNELSGGTLFSDVSLDPAPEIPEGLSCDELVDFAVKNPHPVVLKRVAERVFYVDPERYACCNPHDPRCVRIGYRGIKNSLWGEKPYEGTNPLYERFKGIEDGVYEGVPLLALKLWSGGPYYHHPIATNCRVRRWNIPLPNLRYAMGMFAGEHLLTEWTLDLPNLVDSQFLFDGCRALRRWKGALPNLKRGWQMFKNASLEEWTEPLPSLKEGGAMFWYCPLKEWTVPLPLLEEGLSMFIGNEFEEWTTPLPLLREGSMMFSTTSEKDPQRPLRRWRVPLPSLLRAHDMFKGAKLDLESVRVIAESLPDVHGVDSQRHYITLGLDDEIVGHEQLLHLIRSKGWELETC